MRSSDIANVTIAALSFAFVVVVTMLGLIVRITRKWTRIEAGLETLGRDFATLVVDTSKVNQEISAQMREDRRASNDRLTWLERNMWRTTTGQNHGPGM